MSYRSVGSYYEVPQPMGSYFTFSPHEVYAGYGAVEGGTTIDPAKIMADIKISDVCYGPGGTGQPSGACNAAGQRVNKEMAVALNALGYGPIAVNGSLSWQGAYGRFLSDHGLTKGPGYGITNQALVTMQQLLSQGVTPGGTAVKYEKVGGEYIPVTGKPGVAAAGMSTTTMLLAAVVVGGIGYAAWRAGKKKQGAGGRPPTMV